MSDEYDFLPEIEPTDDQDFDQDPDQDFASEVGTGELAEADDDYPLLSEEAFDNELDALADYAEEEASAYDDAPEDAEISEVVSATVDYPADKDTTQATTAAPDAELTPWAEEERLRQPRARSFRLRLRHQIGMLPLALFLLALGGYLIARQQSITGLPDFSTAELSGLAVLALAFTAIFHALLSGRRERGLLFFGLWVWVTAGLVAALIYSMDDQPKVEVWWPLVLWSLGITLVLTFLIERIHDARLIWVGTIALVAGLTAYGVTSDRIDEQSLNSVIDYWPLLLALLGVSLLPLAFQRRTE